MTRDNVVPWSEYAKEEWERMGIRWSDNTDADPLTVDEEPWRIEMADDRPSGAPAMLGLVMLALAFAAGVLVGWALS